VRIALVSSDWRPTGGVATYGHLLAGALARAGHDVLVMHGDAGAPWEPHAGFRVACAPGALFEPASRDLALTCAALDPIDAFAPDIVHVLSNNNFPLENAVRARRPIVKTFNVHEYCPSGTKFHFATDKPCVVRTSAMCVPRMGYLRCTLSKRPGVWWSAYRHTETANRHHQTFKQLIVCSEHLKQQAVFTGFDPERVSVVPYFTELPAHAAVPASALREILFVGRLVRTKGADLLLDALARVSGHWTASIVGDGPELGALRRRASTLGLADRVSFPGWLRGAALDTAYARAAVVVIPSRWPEPFGIVGIEALAHSRPVIAFDVGGVTEWLEEGVGGWLVPPGDVAALAGRIDRTLAHADEAARIARLGRDRVAREFSPAPHLVKLLQVYERARTAG
jgi:glycosyltransferase involved in cell wall biosynthesis